MSLYLFHLVTGQTIAGRLLNESTAEQSGVYQIQNPLGVGLVPNQGGFSLTTAPFAGIIGMISNQDVVNVKTLHVVGDLVEADEQIESVWVQATSGLQLAKP